MLAFDLHNPEKIFDFNFGCNMYANSLMLLPCTPLDCGLDLLTGFSLMERVWQNWLGRM
jgi:hypothetical protein